MVTTTAQMTDKDLGSTGHDLVRRLAIAGIDIIAIDIPYRQSMGMVRRLFSFFAFMVIASWFAVSVRNVNVVYASSTPLTVGIPALLARWIRGRRFVFEVRDPWPAVPVALGVLRNRIAIYLARRLERSIYRWAKSVVVLSDGMGSLVREVAPASQRIVTVPNCADTEFFRPDIDGDAMRQRWKCRDRFVCVHTGAMGRVNGLDVIVRAAEHFRDDPDLLFVLVGEGRERARLESECRAKGLTNVQLTGSVAKQVMPSVLAAADVCLMTVANVSILEHNSANKLFDYLSAGKPVVLNYGGWQREVLENAGAGVGCDMGNEEAFFALIANLKDDAQKRASMATAARNLAENRFNREALSAKVLGVISDANSR